MADGFFGRWSKRKAGIEADSKEKRAEETKEAFQDLPLEAAAEEAPPLPTLEDVAKIDRFDPDFSAFMKPDVDPVVQQAALKKMFTDPHFNIMDGLDIYIDDYSKPDPLPPGMLERMVQSDMLKLASQASNLSQDLKQAETQAINSSVDRPNSDVQQQTDLISTQPKSTAKLDEVPNAELNQAPIQSEQKKT